MSELWQGTESTSGTDRVNKHRLSLIKVNDKDSQAWLEFIQRKPGSYIGNFEQTYHRSSWKLVLPTLEMYFFSTGFLKL